MIPTSKIGFHKFWWSEQLDELKLATMEATNMCRYAGCPRSGPVNDNRLQCKYRYKLAIKEAIANAKHEFNDELKCYLMKKDDKEFWKVWRRKFCYNSKKVAKVLNGSFGDAAICAEFSEHFKPVCQPNTPERDAEFKVIFDNNMMDIANKTSAVPHITVEDVMKSTASLKLNKSPGHDGVTAEHILYGGHHLQVHLTLLFNAMLRHSYVPHELGRGIIIPLLKDKCVDSSKLDAYRGITLCSTIAKLFELVLLDQYHDQLCSDDLQFGFKKQSGCAHALFAFKETVRYFTMKGGKVYCAFLDASKALDKVMHNGLFVKLLKRNVSISFIQLLANWYSKLTGCVLWNNCYGDVFKVECGVRQGGILYPILFAIYIDDLIKELRLAGFGVRVGAHYMGSMLYADDIALLAGSCYGLQKMLDICTQYGHKWDITFTHFRWKESTCEIDAGRQALGVV